MEEQIPQQNIPQQPPEMPKIKTGSSINRLLISSIAIFVLVTALLIGTLGYLLGSNKSPAPKITTQITPIATLTPTPDPTASWKTYVGDGFSFKYPLNFKVEEREKNYLVIIPIQNTTPAPTQGIAVDARPSNNLANFHLATISAKANLVDVKESPIAGGIKISGVIGPGFGQGLSITEALLQYKNGALDIQTSDSTITQVFFDQILSTFRFD